MTYNKSLTNEEYLKLCEKIADEKYGNEINHGIYTEEAWIPSEPDIKHTKRSNNDIIDITNYKRDKLKEALLKYNNFKLGNFLIRKCVGLGNTKSQDGYDIIIYEEEPYTYLNRPSKKTTKINPNKDTRFSNRPWLKYFTGSNGGTNIPEDTILDIIRWLDAVIKLKCFI